MSWSSRVQVHGKRMSVVYGAAQLPISSAVGVWQKSREVRRHLARTRTAYCLVAAAGATQGIEVWWSAEEAGISVAASLDDWYSTILQESGEAANDCVVIIVFDTSVYLAEVVNGLVKTERVVNESGALEQIHRYRAENRVLHGFIAGNRNDRFAQYVELAPLPFDLEARRFERSFIVFLRNRLYHPIHIVPVLALIVAATLHQIDTIGLWQQVMQYNRAAPVEPQQPVIPLVSHAGGAMLRELVRFMWRLDGLYGDGLQQLEFTPPSGVVLSGQSPQYPSRAKAFAGRHRGQFRWNAAGWAVVIDIAMPDAMSKTPAPTEALLENMSRGWPELALVEGPLASHAYIYTTRFGIDRTGINTFDLMEVAQRLDGYPAIISRLSCSYADYRLTNCEISIETSTL